MKWLSLSVQMMKRPGAKRDCKSKIFSLDRKPEGKTKHKGPHSPFPHNDVTMVIAWRAPSMLSALASLPAKASWRCQTKALSRVCNIIYNRCGPMMDGESAESHVIYSIYIIYPCSAHSKSSPCLVLSGAWRPMILLHPPVAL